MKYVIDTTNASMIASIEASQKSPWVVHAPHATVADTSLVVSVHDSRGEARAYATANGLKAPTKYDPSVYDVVDSYDELVVPTTEAAPEVGATPEAAAPTEAPTTTASPDAPSAAPEGEAPADVKVKADVLRVSSVPLPTKRVWVIADEMHKADAHVKRKDVIARCVAEGIAFYTARTQYQQFYEVRRDEIAAVAAKAATTTA